MRSVVLGRMWGKHIIYGTDRAGRLSPSYRLPYQVMADLLTERSQ